MKGALYAVWRQQVVGEWIKTSRTVRGWTDKDAQARMRSAFKFAGFSSMRMVALPLGANPNNTMNIIYCVDRGTSPPYWTGDEPQREEVLRQNPAYIPFNLEIPEGLKPMEAFNKVEAAVVRGNYTPLVRIAGPA